ncbi:NUDIX domain-containing protein [Isoptericola sp. b441]|uniref:NUDIX domain-containing protein n=1 Tax=Actinotalea lenta TaxID=3064654 RepID=A0ABT9D7K3_9CELL|nr:MULTISPECIES: NUDIX domain-containing protein [unclassified Isoptericola]MDO8106829.1 NUDIX domain-containing protein [Isoptericola sp. b441]MDO8121460.1 NUDIX domain-containing protein [Isoptericola sp. b490]
MLESRTRLVAAAYLVLRRGDEVLLQLRQGTGYRDGHWALLAGHVERDESVLDAAVREAAEEAGVTVTVEDLEPLTTVHRFEVDGPPIEQRVDFFFAAHTWSGEPGVREPHRTADMRWFSLDELPEPVVPHELEVLRALATGKVPAVLAIRMDDPEEHY